MEIKLTNSCFLFRKRFLMIIMRTFIFLLCLSAFSLTPNNVISQNSRIKIEADKTLTVDEVFDLIMNQTDYKFFYEEGMFEDFHTVEVKKGIIRTNKLLNKSLSQGDFNVTVINNNAILIKEKTQTIAKEVQRFEISGMVTDVSKQPLFGANIIEKGTSNGTQTDFDGKFVLNVSNKNAILVVSYIGFVTQEIDVNDQSEINVALLEDSSQLDEVVVVGYGTQRKSDLTGSISVVDIGEAKKTITYDVAKMLQGRVPGVTVQSSGEPGGFVNIKIRGITSFSNNNPLFVIDGVIIDDPYDFAPGEIESMQVLKDASSAAIYGVRGANGVVIITTKQGKIGDLKVKYKSLFGIQNVPNKWSLNDREGYQKVTNAAEANAGLTLAPGNDSTNPLFIDNVDTNWQDEAYKTGVIENHALTFSGGSEMLRYSLNLDYFKNSSYIDTPQDYKRLSTILNLNGSKGKFKYGAKLGYTQSDKESFNSYNAGESSIGYILQAIPTMPVYDENRLGGYGGADNLTQRAITLNPIGYNNLIDNSNKRNRFIGSIWGELEIVKGLKYKINASVDRLDWHTRFFNPPSDLGWYYLTTSEESALDLTNGSQTRTILNNLLTYNIEIDRHSFDVLAGWVQERNVHNNHISRGVGYEPGERNHLEYAADISGSESENEITGISYLSRLNYSYDDRYLMTVNFRQDKTSLFSQIFNRGDFYSFSGAWKISNEKFIQLPEWVSNVKLRGGYGILGNNTIPPYYFKTVINSFAGYTFGDELAPGSTVVKLIDPYVHWEETKTINVGLELGLLDNKVQLTAEYFEKKSTDIIAEVPLPYSTGSFPASIVTNAAAVRNNGVEVSLSYRNSDKAFKYGISANLGTLKNEVLQIGTDDIPIYGAASKTEVGRSVGEIYAYEAEGIFQNQGEIDDSAFQSGAAPGDVKFKDQLTVDTDGDGVFDDVDGIINDDDRTFQGVAIPKYSYGVNFDCSYKNFDFSFFFQGSGGNKVFNTTYRELMIGQYTNGSTDLLNFWTPTNTDTNIPRPIIGDPNANSRDSSRFIESGDYLKLQNIQLGYTIPLKDNKYINRAKIYVTGQNVFTITNYRGYDPDFSSDGLFSRGYERGSFPNPRTFALGVEIDF